MSGLRFVLGCVAILAAVAGTALPATPARKGAPLRRPAAVDWTRIVAATPDGGVRVGNPAARLKLVEYGSLTCPHCAHFAAADAPILLAKYVKPGLVSYEFRNYVRDPFDMTGALLAHCGPPATSRAVNDRIFATQEQWMGKLRALDQNQIAALNALPEGQRLARVAALAGLDAIAINAGVPAARVGQCLADPAALRALADMRGVANERFDLQGTPTFILNGKNSGVYEWSKLEPLLARPGG